MDNSPPEIPGSAEVISWFGRWPSFHDAEIVELHLHRRRPSSITLFTWTITGKVDDRGYYICEKHALVTFTLSNITELSLKDFSHQNVISSLQLDQTQKGFLIDLAGCYGLHGHLEAESVTVSLEPADPKPAC